MKKYKNIDEWKNKILKQHKKAEFKDYDYSISAFITNGILTTYVGFICVGNLKGLIHDT